MFRLFHLFHFIVEQNKLHLPGCVYKLIKLYALFLGYLAPSAIAKLR
jgi:hypothetical protein